jgi:hypothetical protein
MFPKPPSSQDVVSAMFNSAKTSPTVAKAVLASTPRALSSVSEGKVSSRDEDADLTQFDQVSPVFHRSPQHR